VTITIDTREVPAHPLINAHLIRTIGRENINYATLSFGDYVITTPEQSHLDTSTGELTTTPSMRVAIELSSVSDVCGKINSGRLAYQLSGMLDTYDVAILLIESPVVPNRDGYVAIPGSPKAVAYERYLDITDAAQFHGVRIIQTSSKLHVPQRIEKLYNYWQRPYSDHKTFRPVQLKQTVSIPVGAAIDDRVSMLMGLPGVGEDKARAALDTFLSLSVIFAMPPELLQTIPGWGSVISNRVVEFLRTPITYDLPEASAK
jgi:ERCC4-type nuclease